MVETNVRDDIILNPILYQIWVLYGFKFYEDLFMALEKFEEFSVFPMKSRQFGRTYVELQVVTFHTNVDS